MVVTVVVIVVLQWVKRPIRANESARKLWLLQEAFERSPQKPVRRASGELHIPQGTVHRIVQVTLHEFVWFWWYSKKPRHWISINGLHTRVPSPVSFQKLSDEATFHIRPPKSTATIAAFEMGMNLKKSGNAKYKMMTITLQCCKISSSLNCDLSTIFLDKTFCQPESAACRGASNVRQFLNDVFSDTLEHFLGHLAHLIWPH